MWYRKDTSDDPRELVVYLVDKRNTLAHSDMLAGRTRGKDDGPQLNNAIKTELAYQDGVHDYPSGIA